MIKSFFRMHEQNMDMQVNNWDKIFHKKENKVYERTCNIEYNDCHRGIPDIAWNETPEPFLPSSIPAVHFKIWCFKHSLKKTLSRTYNFTRFMEILDMLFSKKSTNIQVHKEWKLNALPL